MILINAVMIMQEHLTKIFRAAGANFLANIFKILVGYVNLSIITHYLRPEEYGIFVLAITAIYMLNRVISFGIPHSFSYFIPRFIAKNTQYYIRSLIRFGLCFHLLLSLFAIAVVLLSGDYLVTKFFDSPELIPILKLLVLTLPFLILIDDAGNIFTGTKQAKYPIFLQHIIQPLMRLVFVSASFILGFRLVGLTIAHGSSVILVSLTGLWLLYRNIFKHLPRSSEQFSKKALFKYSFPLTLSEMIFLILSYTDIFMIGYFLTSDQVGFYNVSYTLAKMLNFLPIAMMILYKPITAELFATHSYKGIHEIMCQVSQWILLLNIPIAGLMIIFPNELLSLAFGSEYAVGYQSLQILSVAFLSVTVFGPIQTIFESSGKTNITFFNSVGGAVLNFVLNYVLITRFGIVGAALATGITMVLMMLVALLEVYILFKVSPFSRNFFRGNIWGVSLISIFCIIKTNYPSLEGFYLIGAAGGFLLIFWVGVFLFRIITKDDLRFIKMALKKV